MPAYAFLVVVFLSLPVLGTTFRPVSIDEQIQEADGIVVGHFLRKKSIELESGQMATQMIFKLSKEWGMQQDLFGMDEVIVHFPGGKQQDKTVVVHGVPQFIMGEKVVLFTKSVDNRYWGLNLGLGSFKVINYGHETMLINSLFPSDSKLGQIKIQDFELKVKELKGSGLKVVMTELPPAALVGAARSPASFEAGKKRSVASIKEEGENEEERSGPSIFLLAAILAVSGGLSHLLRKRGAK